MKFLPHVDDFGVRNLRFDFATTTRDNSRNEKPIKNGGITALMPIKCLETDYSWKFVSTKV